MRLVALPMLVFLAACASPQQNCIRAAQADLHAIDAQIAESEAALARGYRVTQPSEGRTTLNICAWPVEPVLFCTSHTPGQRATRMAVHPPAEEARLVELRRERARLAIQTADRIAACPA